MSQVCSRCGMPVRQGFKFCNVCGAQVVEVECDEATVLPYSVYIGPQGRAVRQLTGKDAGRFFPIYPAGTIGRDDADIELTEDETMSPCHLRISVRSDGTWLEDLDSLNGVFLKIKDKAVLRDNDIIRAGDRYFMYEFYAPERFTEEFGTEFYAAPHRGERFRLIEILSGGRRGRACMAPDGGIVVGRMEGDFIFPEDKRMSDKHFTIRWTQRGGILVDHSANGTFIQIHEPIRVEGGDIFFAGQHLFQIIS